MAEVQEYCSPGSKVENQIPEDKFKLKLENDNHCLNSGRSVYEKLSSNQLVDSAAVAEFEIIETGKSRCTKNERYSFIKQQKILPWVEKVFLISICATIAGGFTVPIIIYAVSADLDDPQGNNSITRILDDFDNCSHIIPQGSAINTSGSVLSLYNDECEEYNGICLEDLNKSNSSLFTQTLNGTSENDISIFANYLNQSSDCNVVVLPFLCQYAFPPCNVSSGNVSYISKTQCTNIRDALCSVESNFAMKISSFLLPHCQNFSDGDSNNTILPIAPQSLQCHYQFKGFCGLCLPLCGKFSQYKTDTKLRERAVIIFSGTAAFIGGIFVFIASAYRRKAMLDFPSVLGVYNTICAFIIACLILITYLGGQERLYCSNERLDVANDNPSLFCQISGFIFHWVLVLLAELWLLHFIHLFIKIAFPMWSRKLDSKQTKIILHVVEVAVALFLCSLAPVLNVILSKYQFRRFPQIFCFPSKEVSFYTICLPLCIMVGIGTILSVIMFWMLHKRHQLFVRGKSKYFYHISFSVPEVKILILSCYFIIFGIIGLIDYSINIGNSNFFQDALSDYFACQIFGVSPSHTCNAEFDRLTSHVYPGLSNTAFFSWSLLPWLNLLFAVQVSDIKKVLQKVMFFYSSHESQDKTLSISNPSSKQYN